MEIVAVMALFGAISAAIAYSRGSTGFGFFFVGLMLGPIGIVVALLQGAKCSGCQKRIHGKAVICPHCRTEQTEAPPPETGPQRLRSGPSKAIDAETRGWLLVGLAVLFLVIVYRIIYTLAS